MRSTTVPQEATKMEEYLGDCRHCMWSMVGSYDEKYRVKEWYCVKIKRMVPNYVLIINCPEFESYDKILHDNMPAPDRS